MPDIDLDAIEAHWLGDVDATDPYQALLDMRADLAALVAELRSTTADLAVAVEVARERGEEAERLRERVAQTLRVIDDLQDERARLLAVAEAAQQVAGAYANPWASEDDRLATIDALAPALDALDAGGGTDA